MSLHWIDKQVLAGSTDRVVRRSDYEHAMAAQDIVAAARASASDLQGRIEALRQDAVRSGHAAGIEQGKAAWARQLAERHMTKQARLLDLQPALLDLVMGALRHLVQELPAERRFEWLAQRVLSSTLRARQLRVVVAAADAASAQAVLHAWRRAHADVLSFDVVIDNGLRRGDCVLETDEGAIDGRLDQRLADIEAALARHLAGHLAEPPAVQRLRPRAAVSPHAPPPSNTAAA